MGVSGSGKSSIGKLLESKIRYTRKEFRYKFYDGDDFHPPANITKMSLGLPLNDFDRSGWLIELNRLLVKGKGVILACSALKKKYRESLNKNCNNIYVYLKGDYDTIHTRIIKRTIKDSHFFNPSMLQSQFDTLEEPTDKELGENQLIVVSIDNDPIWIVEFILCKIKKYI